MSGDSADIMGYDPTPKVSSFLQGKLDVFSLVLIFFLMIFTMFWGTWSKLFPAEYAILDSMWYMALGGIVFHGIVWGWKLDNNFTRREITGVITAVGVGFPIIVIFQFLTIMSMNFLATPKPLQILPSVTMISSAGIPEECIFAFAIFPFFYWLASRGGTKRDMKALAVALLADAMIFGLFHTAVGFVWYKGQVEFLPSVLVGRVIFDLQYYFTEGRLLAPMVTHIFTNFMLSIAMNALLMTVAGVAVLT